MKTISNLTGQSSRTLIYIAQKIKQLGLTGCSKLQFNELTLLENCNFIVSKFHRI